MSDDPTQDLAGKYDTKPTMETLLSEMRAGFTRIDERFDGVEARLGGLEGRVGGLESRFEGLEGRFDKMEGQFNRAISVIHDTRAELIELRREFRERFKEPA
jgi:hypothetical protein